MGAPSADASSGDGVDGSRLPFPVEVPYRIRADLTRLDEVRDPEAALPRDASDASVIAAKYEALVRHADRVRIPDPARSDDALVADLTASLPVFEARRPDIVRRANADAIAARPEAILVDAEGAPWFFPMVTPTVRQTIDGFPAATRLADALALSLPEDLVWMRDDGEGGRASLLHVTFPSHWAPETRAGASLMEFHGPVADGVALRAASGNLMRAMATKGPFRRFVWSLNRTPDLDRHPATTPPPGPNDEELDPLAGTWFRVEQQTTLPVAEANLSIFTIRVGVAPLHDVLDVDPRRAGILAASLRSMSEAVRTYKGVHRPDLLLRALDGYAAAT